MFRRPNELSRMDGGTQIKRGKTKRKNQERKRKKEWKSRQPVRLQPTPPIARQTNTKTPQNAFDPDPSPLSRQESTPAIPPRGVRIDQSINQPIHRSSCISSSSHPSRDGSNSPPRHPSPSPSPSPNLSRSPSSS